MDARLISRRFYLAYTPTLLHKSTLFLLVYSPLFIVSFPLIPCFLFIGRLDCIHKAFSLPLAIMQSLYCLAVFNFPPFYRPPTALRYNTSFGSPCLYLFSLIFSEYLYPCLNFHLFYFL